MEALTREERGAAERIRLRERARIAGEMHDSLGHDLSLIAMRAAALEVAADLDDSHRAAAGLRASVSAATERLHEIIGVLREEGGVGASERGERRRPGRGCPGSRHGGTDGGCPGGRGSADDDQPRGPPDRP
ncbi:hypothetical protein GCM10029963_00580 [Micromonospora andamanensis]